MLKLGEYRALPVARLGYDPINTSNLTQNHSESLRITQNLARNQTQPLRVESPARSRKRRLLIGLRHRKRCTTVGQQGARVSEEIITGWWVAGGVVAVNPERLGPLVGAVFATTAVKNHAGENHSKAKREDRWKIAPIAQVQDDLAQVDACSQRTCLIETAPGTGKFYVRVLQIEKGSYEYRRCPGAVGSALSARRADPRRRAGTRSKARAPRCRGR